VYAAKFFASKEYWLLLGRRRPYFPVKKVQENWEFKIFEYMNLNIPTLSLRISLFPGRS
jgi:hypothetical protein